MAWVFFKVPSADCNLKSVHLTEWRELSEEQQRAEQELPLKHYCPQCQKGPQSTMKMNIAHH